MSGRFWLLSVGVMVAAMAMGLGLGRFAVTPSRSHLNGAEDAFASVEAPVAVASTTSATLAGPGAIHCTGCGPTLNERHDALYTSLDADSYLTGTRDPVVRDYLAEDDVLVAEPPQPLPSRLPAFVRRFAASDVPPPAASARQAAPLVVPRAGISLLIPGKRPALAPIPLPLPLQESRLAGGQGG